MKRLLPLLFIAFGTAAFSQTTISTPTVSGTWTMAGSPYIVMNYINVPAGQVLTIEPGVVVRFVPQTKMVVDGQLIASGTFNLPIIFEANDTTGWANQNATTGGWNGVHFMPYSGGGTDNSILNYCTIKDAKYGYGYLVSMSNAFTAYRSIKIINCNFHHNHSGSGFWVADPPINISTSLATDTIEFNNCNIYDNASIFGIIRTQNYGGGFTKITKSELYNNQLGSAIWGIWNNLLIEDNLIHDNTMNNDNSPIKLSIGVATIRGNKVYQNECFQLAAVGLRSGKITVENNLICNNRQNDAACGLVGGGGGLHLAHNEGGADFNDTYYIVRNNIIANNYSAYGGGGIYVYHAKATISNNHVINNYTPAFGKAILVNDAASEVYMKNNLFYAESNMGVVDSIQILWIFAANKIQLDYNYLPSKYHRCVQVTTPFTLIGDTINNVIGQTPAMIAPTAYNDYTLSALTANFSITAASPCVNQGDTVDCYPSVLDYAGNNRTSGPIDIGAFEMSFLESIESNPPSEVYSLRVHPNPASVNNLLHIITPDDQGMLVIQDITGRIIIQEIVNNSNNEINLPPSAKGLYTISFYGKKNARAKLILE